ncbi:MAG: cupin domain-containing protein [Clostridiales bacterium]|nr:cupin domain-containing protein [Clostridiales bacterium]
MNQSINSEIFPKGEKIKSENFIGATWLKMLIPGDTDTGCSVANVTFEPGARNNWHSHPGGQILLVTSGKGYYQEEGKPVQILHMGDAVNIQSGVKHWHGAAADSWFAHIAISPNLQKGPAEWLEPVKEYEEITQNFK